MCSPTRLVGGPNPDGRYLLAMIRGDRRYRVTGTRGTTAYLGIQVLAGTGMTPRRMAAYLSDTDLSCDAGAFAFVFSADEPTPAELDGAQWVQIPEDAASIVVREYVGDRATEEPATLHIEALDAAAAAATDGCRGGRAVHRDGVDDREAHHAAPHHQARAARPAQRAAHRRGRRPRCGRHHAGQPLHDRHLPPGRDETLVLEIEPPDTRYWNVTLENIWHECIEPRRRHSRSPTRASRPTPTARCGSRSAPRTSAMATGSTPVAATAASSCSAGSTTRPRPR